MDIPVGAKGKAEMVVTQDKTAAAVGSGSIEVFATPWMIAMMELSACNALAPFYDEGQSSVGTKLDVSHDAATPIGMKVCAEAEVVEVDRRRIVFQVTAWDEAGVIGKGTHERFLINAEKFLAKVEAKKQ
ncbi:MAG: thioesterase family protein [Oscillospiraceae bacterium]|nr:thioesterase family protein [Oscillospiraceae bacterium]